MLNVTRVARLQTSRAKPIRVEMKLQNNLILTMMEQSGITSLMSLAKASGCRYEKLRHLVAMKIPALDKYGAWQKEAILLSDFFECAPEELFSADQKIAALETNRAQVEIDYSEIQLLGTIQSTPDKIAEAKELKRVLGQALMTLTPREHRVLSLRFGLTGNADHTLEEVAEILGFSSQFGRERVRQIEAKAIRKLRLPNRSESIMIVAGLRKFDRRSDCCDLDGDILEAMSQA